MCGVVGCAGEIGIKEEKAFELLLKLDTLRGAHSTGVLRVGIAGHYSVDKSLGTPWDLFSSKTMSNFNSRLYSLLAGHNRYATKGKVTEDNAHPFEIGDYIGMHNGTLTNQWELNNYRDFDVDSANIFHHMNLNGEIETLETIRGAYSLIWWNKSDQTLNLCRNSERPLHFVMSKNSNTLFWASEEWMLTIALGKAGVSHEKIESVPILKLFKITLADKPNGVGKVISKVKTSEFKENVNFFAQNVNNFGNHYLDNTSANTYHSPFPKKDGDKVIDLGQRIAAKDLNSTLGKDIEFTTTHVIKRENKVAYIRASYVNEKGKSSEVRLYIGEGHKDFKTLRTPGTRVRGKSKKISIDGQTKTNYILVAINSLNILKKNEPIILQSSPTTIIDVDNKEGSLEGCWFRGYNGQLFQEKEFLERFKHGCGCCSSPPVPSDSDNYYFISSQDYICWECQGTEFFRSSIKPNCNFNY